MSQCPPRINPIPALDQHEQRDETERERAKGEPLKEAPLDKEPCSLPAGKANSLQWEKKQYAKKCF